MHSVYLLHKFILFLLYFSVPYAPPEETKARIVLGTKAYYANLKFFKSRLVTEHSKLRLYRSVIRPIVTYAAETWVLKES